MANVSHDLKTPLTAITTYVELLKKEDITEEERRSYIETLDKKSQRLKILIEDLFEVSKATSNNIVLHPMEVDVVNLLKQVAVEHTERFAAMGLTLRWDVPEEKVIVVLDNQKTFRIFENLFVIQIKVIITNIFDFVTLAKCIIKCCIQMIICTADPDNVPGMTVFDTFFRIVSTYCDHAPDAQRIQKDFYRFCNALADTNALSERADDLMGISFFQLVIMYILTDKVMYIFLLFPLGKALYRAHQLLYSGFHCLLMFFHLRPVKQIFRQKLNVRRFLIITILKSRCPENLRMIQPKLKKHII